MGIEPMERLPEAPVDPRALFSLCDTHGFARPAATAALRTSSGVLDDALAYLLAALSPWQGETKAEGEDAEEETRQEELEALDAIYGDAFSRPTARRAEIRLQRDDDEPPVSLTMRCDFALPFPSLFPHFLCYLD